MSVKEEVIDKHLDHIVNFRRRLHKKPELSFKEFETTDMIVNGLEDTKIKFYELSEDTGAIGVLEKDPDYEYVGVRADIDALPIEEETDLEFKSEIDGRMHACGHDIHSSILYGFAKVIDELYDDLKYNIVFIFQPAEEILKGAKYIKEELKRLEVPVDKIVMYHTWPNLNEGLVGYRDEQFCAGAQSFNVKLKAKGGHAAHPHKTADPVYLAADIIHFIQAIVSRYNNPATPLVMTIGQIHAGERNNVIPDVCTFGGTMRSFSEESIKDAREIMEKYIKEVTAMVGADYEIEFKNYCPPLINTPEVVEEFVNAGEDESVYHKLKEPSMGSEDFSFYLDQYVGAAFRIGTRMEDVEESGYSLHSPEIIFSEKSIRTGIKALVDFTTRAG